MTRWFGNKANKIGFDSYWYVISEGNVVVWQDTPPAEEWYSFQDAGACNISQEKHGLIQYTFKVAPFPAPSMSYIFHSDDFPPWFQKWSFNQLTTFVGVGIKLDANAWWFGRISDFAEKIDAFFGVWSYWPGGTAPLVRLCPIFSIIKRPLKVAASKNFNKKKNAKKKNITEVDHIFL